MFACLILLISVEKSLSPWVIASYIASLRPAAFIAFLVSSATPLP
jgi:hypothetical protein